MLYDDDDKAAAEALRESPVAKAQRSPAALAKSANGRTADGAPVHDFQLLFAGLATLALRTSAGACGGCFGSCRSGERRRSFRARFAAVRRRAGRKIARDFEGRRRWLRSNVHVPATIRT